MLKEWQGRKKLFTNVVISFGNLRTRTYLPYLTLKWWFWLWNSEENRNGNIYIWGRFPVNFTFPSLQHYNSLLQQYLH